MAKKYTLPELPKLSRAHPEYVSKLEEGLLASQNIYDQEAAKLEGLVREKYTSLLAKIGEVPGVEIRSLTQDKQANDFSEDEITVQGMGAMKTVSEVLQKGIRDLQGYAGGDITGQLAAAQGAVQKFQDAIGELTELTPLYVASSQAEHARLYVVENGLVYEGYVRLDEEPCAALIYGGKTADILTEGEQLTALLERFKGGDANIYKVTNPSTMIPAAAMFEQALDLLLLSVDSREDNFSLN